MLEKDNDTIVTNRFFTSAVAVIVIYASCIFIIVCINLNGCQGNFGGYKRLVMMIHIFKSYLRIRHTKLHRFAQFAR